MGKEPEFRTLLELGHYTNNDDEEMLLKAQSFLAQISSRHTIREFSPDPVPRSIIETCIAAAGRAPSGANHQPWHFVAVQSPEIKRRIRLAAEEEERAFYGGRASQEWLDALAPIGTDAEKPFLETAPWLIAVFAQRRGGPSKNDDLKNYYVTESVGLACGFLIAALHQAGLGTLTHTPNPMSFLNETLGRPETEKPFVLLVVGRAMPDAQVPEHALSKKPVGDILTVI
ncbi:MAG: nitroreductase family protein [Pseudomonadota bacterium]